jgi:hypothetical protein
MEDVRHSRFAGAPTVIVAWGMSEPANKAFAGMEPLLFTCSGFGI